MDKTISKQEQKNFYNVFNSEVEKYIKDGTSKPQAISLISKKFGLSPYKIINKYYSDIKPEDLDTYKDIKTEEGSFVTLNNDSNQNHYEVININNKDAIVLRNTDNNEEITASENEITPVITENKMDKLNEAQYNISINGLETQDAATLSQMLNLASQAETSNGSMIAPAGIQSDMAVNPMPMDMDSGLPMDMDAVDTDLGMEEPIEDDIEFDEELPSDISIEEPMDDMPMDNEPLEDESLVDDAMASNDLGVDEMSMDDMIDNNMYDDFMGESFDYDALIKEALEAAEQENLEESEEIVPAGDEVEDNGQLEGEQEQFAEEITVESVEEDADFDSEIAEALRIAGVELNEAYNGNFETVRRDILSGEISDEEAISALLDMGEAESEEEALDIINGIKEEGYSDYDEPAIEENADFDSEIAEALRIAGVELNEEVTDGPEVVDQETLFINKDNEAEGQEPEYHEVETASFGKDASEGMKKPMTFEAAVNVDKIKSIYETAKSMYAKKESSEWLSLDRRYVEKLIKEGVGYEKASKMIMEAKKGK